MQTHLMEFKSSDSLRSQVGLNKLNFCMMVLKKIKQTFSSATFIHNIFLNAIERLHSRHSATARAPTSLDDTSPAQDSQLLCEDYSFLNDPFWGTSFL
ncbi:hypothetical protein BDZ45DRAFT_672226 [Acephala macrosclerotiorum]|nr:hypothetical protein BDZ45DRAFT_672226 [Acephala macrosclerotiorum]